MKKIIKKLWLVLEILVVLFLIAGIVSCIVFTSKNELKIKDNIITIQNNKEKKLVTKGYNINNPNVILNPYGNSPLTALILFETDDMVSPVVTVKGKDKLSTFTHKFSNSKKHYLNIYGLYADYNNKIVISYGNIKKIIYIKTEKLPSDFVLPSSVVSDKTKLTNDLYFYTPSSIGYTCAYDVNGDVRWYLTNYALWKIDRLNNGHLLVSTDRLINNPYYMTGLYEIDLLGKVYTEYSLEGGYHHDYYEMDNGNLLVLSNDFYNKSGTVEDFIVELDRKTGAIIKTFDLKDVLNMEDGKSENWVNYDWFHNNSVWYDKNTNSITLSGRHQDAVINIDYKSGKLNWIVGDDTNWSDKYKKYFFTPVGDNFEWQWSQHAAMITPEGYLFVFDNGNNKSKIKEEYVSSSISYSRGVLYKYDTKTMTIKQIWEYGKERGSSYYSPYISDVDYIDSNHYIIHSGGISSKNGIPLNVPAGLGGADTLKSVTTELLNDKIIFELTLPTNNYRTEKMSLYGKDNFTLGKGNTLGNLGRTKVDKTKLWIYPKVKDIDNIYKSHNINIKAESDRLVFNGTFKKSDDVKIILYKNMIASYYKVPISKRPYTAMCVDLFTKEETSNGINVTKYINSVSLYDKYSLYISINGEIYKVNKYIDFYE